MMQSTLNKLDLNQYSNESIDLNDSLTDNKQKSSSHVQYLMDPIVKSGLVTKQAYSYKDCDKRTKHQILLILSRFHRDFRTRNSILTEKLVEMLKNAPDYTMSMARARTELAASDVVFKSGIYIV